MCVHERNNLYAYYTPKGEVVGEYVPYVLCHDKIAFLLQPTKTLGHFCSYWRNFFFLEYAKAVRIIVLSRRVETNVQRACIERRRRST